MTQGQYQTSIWVKSDSTGLILRDQGSEHYDGGMYQFPDPLTAFRHFENILNEISKYIPIEDSTQSISDDSNILVEQLVKQFDLFGAGKESCVRMTKIRDYENTVLYKRCGDDDSVPKNSNRGVGTFRVEKKWFKNNPPPFITIRVSDSLPM